MSYSYQLFINMTRLHLYIHGPWKQNTCLHNSVSEHLLTLTF